MADSVVSDAGLCDSGCISVWEIVVSVSNEGCTVASEGVAGDTETGLTGEDSCRG